MCKLCMMAETTIAGREGDGGRFLFINGILCKTADDSGAFRPRDVFSSVTPRAVSHDEAGAAHDGGTAAELTSSSQATDVAYETVDSDCPLFNTFGVLSRGVVIDAWARTFVDCADAMPYTPAMLATDVRASSKSIATAATENEAMPLVNVQQLNMQAYRNGTFADIRAEAVLSFCSSLRPYTVHHASQHVNSFGAAPSSEAQRVHTSKAHTPCPCTVCATHTPPSWPDAPWLTPQRALYIAHANVATVLQRSCLPKCDVPNPTAPPKGDQPTSHKRRCTSDRATRRVEAFMSLCRKVEAFRLHNIAAEPASIYLPSFIPFRFQCDGAVLRSAPSRKRGRSADDFSDGVTTVEATEKENGGEGEARAGEEDGMAPLQQRGVSSFTCFAGLPLLVRGAYSTPRNDLMHRPQRLCRAHELRRLLRPARTEASVHVMRVDDEGGSAAVREHSHAHGHGDGIESFLVPPASLPSRLARDWWTFRVYFAHLGVLRASVQGDDGTTTTVYKLCSDTDFSAARAVQQKRREVHLRRHHVSRRRHSGLTSGTGPVSNLAFIADVWDYLLAHDRRALMRRLHLLEAHLATLRADDVNVEEGMLRWSVLWRCMVSAPTLQVTAVELNRLLQQKYVTTSVPRDELKAFLRDRVMPLLQCTALDRRYRTTNMRRYLARLVRDAAFSAQVLRARPTGGFVQCIVDCLVHDSARMRFIPQLTSAQASHIIANLAVVGVTTPAVYATLVGRVEFVNLADAARTMTALMRIDLHELSVNAVVPLYSGEQWTLQPRRVQREDALETISANLIERQSTSTLTGAASTATVQDALSTLRALSKSVRHVMERHRGNASAVLPMDSISALRDALLRLVFVPQRHELKLRAAQWLLIARALASFPRELQQLPAVAPYTALVANTHIAPDEDTERGTRVDEVTVITCDDLARVALQRLFATATPAEADVASSEPVLDDINPLDTAQIVTLVQSLYGPTSPQRRHWLDLLFASLLHQLPRLDLDELVHLLRTMRLLEARPLFRSAVNSVVQEVGQRLTMVAAAATTTTGGAAVTTTATVRFPQLVQFALALSVFHVARCDGFVRYLAHLVASHGLPPHLTLESGVALLRALATVSAGGGRDGAEYEQAATAANDACQTVALQLVEYLCHATAGAEATSSPGWFAQSPLMCIRLWRALVTLRVTPSPVVVAAIFGPKSQPAASVTPALRAAGASALFDLARLLSYYVREPGRLPPTTQELLWHAGLCRTLLPLLLVHTTPNGDAVAGDATTLNTPHMADLYVPRAWSCTMDTVALYLDVNLDQCTLSVMLQRLGEAGPACQRLVAAAARVTACELCHIAHASTSQEQLKRRFHVNSFVAVAVRNYLACLLVWEFVLYHAVWQATRPTQKGPGSDEGKDKAVDPAAVQAAVAMKQDYVDFLHRPIDAAVMLPGAQSPATPLELLHALFAMPYAGRSATAPTSLLRRSHVLEITNGLPFAISLVVAAGPASEAFCEHAFPLMAEPELDVG